MKKNIKIILLLGCISIILVLAIQFFKDAPYRQKLPEYPDMKSDSESLRAQIRKAGSRAFYLPTVKNLGELGLVYHSNGYSDRAAICYQLAEEKSIRNNSKEWIWSYYLGCLNLEKGESKTAIDHFTKVRSVSPGNYQALFYIGEANQNLGFSSEAKKIFRQIYNLKDEITVKKTFREFYFPLQTHAGFSLANLYLNDNQPDSAEIILKEIIQKKWTFGPAYHLLGEVYGKKGNPELAKKFRIRSGDLINNVPYADTLLDKLALTSRSEKYLLKQIESAKVSYNFNWEYQICSHGLRYLPESKFIISNILSLYFYLGKDKEALPLLDKHLKFYSEDYDELFRLANLLSGKGLETEALKYFEQAKKLQPENSRLAIWLLEQGKRKEAELLMNQQLQKNPDNERTLTDAVHLFVNLGNQEKASALLTVLKKSYPKNAEGKKAIGLLLEMNGNLKDAIPIYEEVAKEKDLSMIKYLASIYLRYQKWDKALQNFKSGLESFPNETDLLEPLGRLLISCPDSKFLNIEEGREYSERAYTHCNCPAGTRVLAARNLATAYAILGNRQLASNYMNITLELVQRLNMNPQEYLAYFKMLRQKYNLS